MFVLAAVLIAPVVLIGDDDPADEVGPPVPPAEMTPPTPPTQPAGEEVDGELQELRKQQERLALEIGLRQQELAEELADAKDEITRLQTQQQLAQLKQQGKLAELEAQKAQLDHDAQLEAKRHEIEMAKLQRQIQELTLTKQHADLELQKALADAQAEKQRLDAGQALEQAQLADELAEMARARQRIEAENQTTTLKMAQENLAHEAAMATANRELATVELEIRKLTTQHNLEMQKAMLAHVATQQEVKALQTRLAQRAQRDDWRAETNKDVPRRAEPFVDGVLYVSDRRIDLGEIILTGSASYIADRVHFYNNESTEDPIFVVIDDCTGGSALEGTRILKILESSEAPIHVVAKSYAASMAAIILSRAEHSYIMPDAFMMHHQMLSRHLGNTTEMSEDLDEMQKWQARLLKPVATRMGLSVEQLIEKMYEQNSEGNWEVFGDQAVALKWVDHVATEVREEGIIRRPSGAPPEPWYFSLFDFREDESGRPYVVLPRLRPYDVYFIHNPDNYYRW